MSTWCQKGTNTYYKNRLKSITLNFGPQHPASHGVLRLVLQLNGELVEKLDPHIGYLHRGSEKLMEFHDLRQASLYLDRLDYTSVLTQTHAYCLAVETILVLEMSEQTLIIRTLFDELARLLNHLLANSTHSLDVGSMAPLFWAFEEREKIMELFEYVSGARMHVAFYLPGTELCFFGLDFFFKILLFLRNCYKAFSELFICLFNNRVWKLRLVNIGVLGSETCFTLGITGPILRSTGIAYDLRALIGETYAFYYFTSIRIFVGQSGDSYDRFLIRSRELFESILIIYQCLSMFDLISFENIILNTINSNTELNTIEALISHFSYILSPYNITENFHYSAVEAGKGEFGVFLTTTVEMQPYRVYLRSPAFNHLQLIGLLCSGHLFADVITIIGTLDLVFGEIDR